MANEKLLADKLKHELLKLGSAVAYWERRMKVEGAIPPHLTTSGADSEIEAGLAQLKSGVLAKFDEVDWETGWLKQ